jgi:hypothetical protein
VSRVKALFSNIIYSERYGSLGICNFRKMLLLHVMTGFVLVVALRPQTPEHITGSWSHYTDTSEPVDGNGAQNVVTVQCGFGPGTFPSLAQRAYQLH